MHARIALPALCVSLVLSWAVAQTTGTPQNAPEKKAAVRETPPDVKAFTELNKITDPEKKIEAIQKWKTDFPASNMQLQADQQILSTLVQKLPEQKDRIRKTAAAWYRKSSGKSRAAVSTMIADSLLSGGILLKEAESYARKSLDSMVLAEYLKEQIESYQKRKQTPPAPQELQKRFQSSRATKVATLGRIEVKLGQVKKGQKLLEEAYSVNPDNVVVAGTLGELAAKAGDDRKAMDYLLTVRLSGRASKSNNDAFESIYRKSHNGSLDGLETNLDGEYHKRFPNPVHVESYQPSAKRSDRMVLAEVFTGSGCPPCVAADLAFDAAMNRYARKDLAVIMYHEHVPRPDPMTNPDTNARYKTYSVAGVPTFLIDGKKTIGGGSRENAKGIFDKFQKDLEADLETPAEATLTASAVLSGKTVKVRASVDGVKSESKDLKLQIALAEKELRYSGENGIRFHPMVVRAMGGEKGEGFAVDPAAGAGFEYAFDLDAVSKAIKDHLDDYESKGHRGEPFKFTEKKYQIDRADLAVVVFVHDEKTKHVLQAAYIDLSTGPGTHTITEANDSK